MDIASGQHHLLPEIFRTYLRCFHYVGLIPTLIQMIIKTKVIICQKLWYVSHVCNL